MKSLSPLRLQNLLEKNKMKCTNATLYHKLKALEIEEGTVDLLPPKGDKVHISGLERSSFGVWLVVSVLCP